MCCTPGTVCKELNEIEELAKELDLMLPSGELKRGDLLWCCDEKGLDLVKDSGLRANISQHSGCNGTTQLAGGSLKHMTALAFINAAGGHTSPGVIVAGKLYNKHFIEI